MRNKRNDVYVWLKPINSQKILYYDDRVFMAPTVASLSKFIFEGFSYLFLKWRHRPRVQNASLSSE